MKNKKLSFHKNNQAGLSIIELLFSLALISIMLVLYQVSLNTLKLNEVAKDREIALSIANAKMQELRSTVYNSLPVSGSFSDSQLSLLSSGSGAITITNYNDNVKQVVVTVQWHRPGTQNNSTVSLTTLMTSGGI